MPSEGIKAFRLFVLMLIGLLSVTSVDVSAASYYGAPYYVNSIYGNRSFGSASAGAEWLVGQMTKGCMSKPQGCSSWPVVKYSATTTGAFVMWPNDPTGLGYFVEATKYAVGSPKKNLGSCSMPVAAVLALAGTELAHAVAVIVLPWRTNLDQFLKAIQSIPRQGIFIVKIQTTITRMVLCFVDFTTARCRFPRPQWGSSGAISLIGVWRFSALRAR